MILRTARAASFLSFTLMMAGSAVAGVPQFDAPHLISDAVPGYPAGSDDNPQLATDGAGHWVAVWSSTEPMGGVGADGDVIVSRSSDNGATWTAPAFLNTNAATDSDGDFSPRVVTDGAGNWLAAWSTFDSLGGTIGTDGDVLFARSTDNGATWTAPAALNTDASGDSDGDFNVALSCDGTDTCVAAWTRFGASLGNDGDIVFARSTNDGATWSPPLPLYASATSDSGGEFEAQLANDGSGNWIAVTYGFNGAGTGFDFDCFYVTSSDNGSTWSALAALNPLATVDSAGDYEPDVSTDGAGNWVAVWWSQEDVGGSWVEGDVYAMTSTNNGATWSAAVVVNSNATTDISPDRKPTIQTDGAGNWIAAWHSDEDLGGVTGSDADILYARSTNAGATWTTVASLNTTASTDTGDDNNVRIATDGTAWIALWFSNDTLGDTTGTDNDIFGATSTNAGATWSAVIAVNTNAPAEPDIGADTNARMATDGNGNWVVVWASNDSQGGTLGTEGDILVAHSSDDAATWSDAEPLNSAAAIDYVQDGAPKIATDGAGRWIAAWHYYDSSAGDWDLAVARSTDNGATWSAQADLNTNAASDDGPDVDVEIASDGAGNWVAVWTSYATLGGTLGTDSDILVAHSGDNGMTWSAPTALNTNAATDSGYDTYPSIATDGQGNWLAVWESTDSLGGTLGTDRDILWSASTNTGISWNAPAALNTNAAMDTGEDANPQISSDGAGHWVTVWTTTENIGGTIGTDGDVVAARSVPLGWSAPVVANSRATVDGEYDFDADLATDGAGTWVVVWHSSDTMGGTTGFDADVLYASSTDNGATWTTTLSLNTNAATDSGNDLNAEVMFDGAGQALAIWHTDDGIGGEAGYGIDDIVGARGTICGDGILVGSEECDDGGYCCNASCEAAPVDPMTCLVAPAAKLQVTASPMDLGKQKLSWQWGKGDAFDQADVGTPLVDTQYHLCIFDTSTSTPSLAASLTVDPSATKWTSSDPKGAKYKDKDATADGVTQLQLKTGLDTKTKVKVQAKGANVPLPLAAGATYFDQDPKVVVQLRNSEGSCWTSEFVSGDNKKHDATSFKAQTK